MLEALAFVAGIHLTMMIIATGYHIIDVWHDIAREATRIAARLAILGAINIAACILLPDTLATALCYGQLFFLAFHIVFYWIAIAWVRFPR